jgi:hypothetical protein
VSTAFLAPSAVILAATALVIALAVIIPGAAASYLLGRPTGTLPAVGTMFEAGPASANAPAACGTKHSPVSTAKRCLPSCRYSVTSRIAGAAGAGPPVCGAGGAGPARRAAAARPGGGGSVLRGVGGAGQRGQARPRLRRARRT